VPLAAFLAPAALVDAVAGAGGFHVGHTHKAHPLACAVGLAVLAETVDNGLIDRARETGAYLRAQLLRLQEKCEIIGDVRGLGMLNAVEIVADRRDKRMWPRAIDVVGRVQALAREAGLLIYGRRTHAGRFGDWIMVSPPLIATHADVDEIVAGLGQCLGQFAHEMQARG